MEYFRPAVTQNLACGNNPRMSAFMPVEKWQSQPITVELKVSLWYDFGNNWSSTLFRSDDMIERVCWTRMQTEAGEGLSRIVSRKEIERRTGDGLFFWGVGSAPSRAIPALARSTAAIDVLFSVMKSKPKACDVEPGRIVAWNSFVDTSGIVRPIPPNVLVTSRAGSRNCHYALICHSDVQLGVADEGPFDPRAFRNVGAGGAVGASQVTALLERHTDDIAPSYRIAMRARLTGAMWVKLVDPIEVDGDTRLTLPREPEDEESWLAFVARVRCLTRPSTPTHHIVRQQSFAV